MVNCKDYCRRGVDWYFQYDTPKVVRFRSLSIGFVNRAMQWVIMCYILFYVLIANSGYQDQDTGIPGSTSEVRGIATTNLSDRRVGRRIWDAQDVVIPAEENSAFFVTTNALVTNGQKQGQCPEDPHITEALCKTDADCPHGRRYLTGHGVSVGQCVKTTGTCMIEAWCPLENDTLTPKDGSVLHGTEEFTVLIKNHVYFPKFNVTRSNIIRSSKKTELTDCLYDPDTNPFCPNFKLGYMVEKALSKTSHPTTYDQMADEGLSITDDQAFSTCI